MHRAEMKLFLNVVTARSEEFPLCMCGGTSWKCMSDSSKYCSGSFYTSLSMMCSCGVNPHFLLFSINFFYLN